MTEHTHTHTHNFDYFTYQSELYFEPLSSPFDRFVRYIPFMLHGTYTTVTENRENIKVKEGTRKRERAYQKAVGEKEIRQQPNFTIQRIESSQPCSAAYTLIPAVHFL